MTEFVGKLAGSRREEKKGRQKARRADSEDRLSLPPVEIVVVGRECAETVGS